MKAFQCKMCGSCCFGKGGITLRDNEIEDIRLFLAMELNSFKARYCEERHGRLSIKTGINGACIFYNKEGKCRIHPVKPSVCSRWPFYPALVKDRDTWKMAQEACPGINPDCSFDEFIRQAKEYYKAG